MALPLGVAIALLLSVVQLCVCDGSASSIGQNNLLDAGQQNMTTPTTSPVTASPLCPGKQDLLHVEASHEARKALVGWLAKDTARLIFIYFDLVVGNLTYHPGSCPDDGMSAIDAETPLAWVLTSGGPDGGPGAPGSHSFAHAYLTLPVSYPRIYSMGILEGHYVANLRHEVYKMKVVIDNSSYVDGTDCWADMNTTEKTSAVLEVIQGFVSDLERATASKNTSSWRVCYSDPTVADAHFPTSSSALLPHTPAYICQNEYASVEKLERDSFLKGLHYLFVGLCCGSVVLQFFAFSKALNFLWFWGARRSSRKLLRKTKTFDKDGLFDKSRLPDHVTVGGLLSSDIAFGQRAFFRLKFLLVWTVCCLVYGVLTNLLVHYILLPTDSIAKLRVSSSETLDSKVPCHVGGGGGSYRVWYVTYSVYGPLFVLIFSVFVRNSRSVSMKAALLKSFSVLAYAFAPLIFLIVLKNIKYILQVPIKRPWLKVSKFRNTGRSAGVCALFVAFLLAQLLFWLPLLVVMEILILVSALLELHMIFPCNMSRSKTFLFTPLGLLVQSVLFYTQGSELFMFILLTTVSLYISYPLQTFLVISWTLSFISEAQNLLHDYRSPLLAVQRKFVDKCMVLAKNHTELQDRAGEHGPTLTCSVYLKDVSNEGEAMNWQLFIQRSQQAWNKACLQVLLMRNKAGASFRQLAIVQSGANPFDEVLDVRADTEDPTLLKLQKVLWERFFYGIVRFLFLLLLFLSIVLLLLAFNSLWKDPNPRDTNSLLLTILIVPLYTFVRTKLDSSSLTSNEKLLLDKILDTELENCFRQIRDSLNRVRRGQPDRINRNVRTNEHLLICNDSSAQALIYTTCKNCFHQIHAITFNQQ